MAWWQRIAATDESTPPDRPQMARPVSPTLLFTAAMASSVKEPGVHDGSSLATSKRKAPRSSAPRGVCTTSGWNWIPYR